MEKNEKLTFENPSFIKRIKSMLSVDFYRLFHTPLFYIFIAIAAIIPAMILGMTSIENPQGFVEPLYTNTWQVIAADSPLYIVNGIAEYANMNMVFIFGGIMVSIFIGHDYKSGYVKQLFTTHAKKQDYMISKSTIGAFSMACMSREKSFLLWHTTSFAPLFSTKTRYSGKNGAIVINSLLSSLSERKHKINAGAAPIVI